MFSWTAQPKGTFPVLTSNLCSLRPSKNAAFMFNLAIENPDIPCPHCQRILVELSKFRESMHEDGTLGSEFSPFLRSGWRFAINPLAVVEWMSSALDTVIVQFRNRKIEAMCVEILPRYPRTLICPHCLFLEKRI